ncbi:isocitrate lyase/PEP mutase family protein [Halomarina pelagica]|uniref:isocitrate lyase/PEP mutase family protein n=1 Tax=Halomarina pelagica TaxID=2961599 RepID=UPI0020C4F396|nr:isocitrate lyase/phosphoenolpyruvate mutase family protein [Halomarina sp. BND7]
MDASAPGRRFLELVNRAETLRAVGAFDGLSAKLVEEAGGEVVYVSGSAVSTSVHGKPDVGLTTMTEMVDRARNVVEAVDVPVFCDADTGYGNALNVRRTVERFERAGVAAIHLEDQRFPKRCGHFEGKRVVPREEMVRKLRAAVDARDDLAIVARTDAAAVTGLDDAIDRARAYADAGADVLFVEAPESRADLERVGDELGDVPLLANMVEGGRTPLVHADELSSMGFDVALYPTTGQKAAAKALREVYGEIFERGTQVGVLDRLVTWEERNEITGLASIRELEARYAGDDA